MIVLVACSVPKSATWLPDERTGLGTGEGSLFFGKRLPIIGTGKGFPLFDNRLLIKGIERVIKRPLDTHNVSSGEFDLYYFIRRPVNRRGAKTVLFIAGGPGFFNPGPFEDLTMADFLLQNDEYNVVHFHPRGAGFSQVPPNNYYDRFLKTSYVVEDIESIREDLIRLGFLDQDGRWDAVIGYSYGTVVAQQYAGTYPHNVKKMLLIGVQSRHLFESTNEAFSQIMLEIRDTNRYTLATILQSSAFDDIPQDDKQHVVDRVFGIGETEGDFQKAERIFGGLPFLIASFCEPAVVQELKNSGLDRFSKKFFIALRGLRQVGWKPTSPDRRAQIEYAGQILREIGGITPEGVDCSSTPGLDDTGSSDRVFYIVTTYDGINIRLLDALQKSEKKHVLDALHRSGGEAHFTKRINKFLNKVGIADDEKIVPWNPAKHQYDGPTMILQGSADTVGAGGAAEHFFSNALTGVRVLIKYPGIGHEYRLPLMFLRSLPKTFPSSDLCELDDEIRGIRDCLIYSFLKMSPKDFIDSCVNKILPVIIEDKASVFFKDSSSSKTIAGTCP